MSLATRPRRVGMAEERETMLQRGLSEWWCEETEYVFQRIERWAALARGYNRLRSQRWPKGRQLSQDAWHASPSDRARFCNLKRARRKSCPEETRGINRCDAFDYRSNGKLDSNCLEVYWYDHSIYFKTIGDIRSGKREVESKASKNDDEPPVRDVGSIDDNGNPSDVVDERGGNRVTRNAWPIVDLSKLDLNLTSDQGTKGQGKDE